MNPRKRKSTSTCPIPRKFSRNYFIENLLFGVQQQQQHGTGTKTTSDYVELLDIAKMMEKCKIKIRNKEKLAATSPFPYLPLFFCQLALTPNSFLFSVLVTVV
ncbi:hypothetical protein ACQ4LE_010667 [Meloidogyne hapla]